MTTGDATLLQHTVRRILPLVDEMDIFCVADRRYGQLVRDQVPRVVNMFPRCVTREGNKRAQQRLWSVFRPVGGRWR